MENIIPAFNYVKDVPILDSPSGKIAGLDYLGRVAGMAVGNGDTAMHADESGLWLGAERFADARFSVDMNGNLTISSATSGARIIISAVNKNILVHDGTNYRVLIGFQSGGF